MKIDKCRICGQPLSLILTFGKMPIVNYYLSKEELKKEEKKFSLNFCICGNCSLGQLDELIPPQDIFVNYHYASSVSSPLKKHLEDLAKLCIKKFKLNDKSDLLDIGCNDGVLLAEMKRKNINTLGVDPAKNIVINLKSMNIPALDDFFSFKLAQKIAEKQKFDLIAATNTLAQIIDLGDFIKGVKLLLKKNGVFVAEVGYMLDMIKKHTFDAIYHEHYSYFTLRSLIYLCKMHGMRVYDAQRISNHGGSLRIYATIASNKKYKTTKRLKNILNIEKKYHLEKPDSYLDFVNYFSDFKNNFRNKLISIRNLNKNIAGITSPAKGVILLNYCEIDNQILNFIVDSTPYKQYRYMPGVHIPIFPESELERRKVDYILILAWNYKIELLRKLEKQRKNGAKIIIPFPKLEII